MNGTWQYQRGGSYPKIRCLVKLPIMKDLITAHFPLHEIKELNIIFLTVYILDDVKPVFDICLKSNALYILCMYACSILACRSVGSYLRLGGQVVMWEAQSAPLWLI